MSPENRSIVFALVAILALGDVTSAWLFSGSSSSRGGGGAPRSFPHDVRTQSGLTRLYNSRVTHVEHVRRPLGSGTRMVGPLSHSGVVVTTRTGQRYLVHKGDGYGRTSQTVVTDARHMSPRWQTRSGHDVTRSRVSDYVRAGGSNYDLLRDNCHSGSCRMMGLP